MKTTFFARRRRVKKAKETSVFYTIWLGVSQVLHMSVFRLLAHRTIPPSRQSGASASTRNSRIIGSLGLIVPMLCLFADDLDEDTVRKALAAQKMDGTVTDKATQHLSLRWS